MIEWVISSLGIPLVKKVPDIVDGWIKDRQQTRMEILKAQLTLGLEAQRHYNAVEFANLQAANQIRAQLVSTFVTDKPYPLKLPGTVASASSNAAMPNVLIAPPPGDALWLRTVDVEATRIMRGVEGIHQFASVPVDAFWSSESAPLQVVVGEREALTIAEVEFVNCPAIIVFFQQAGGVVTVRALFTNALSTQVGNGPTVCETIGRYFVSSRGGGGRATVADGRDAIDLSGVPGHTPARVLAHCVAWFVPRRHRPVLGPGRGCQPRSSRSDRCAC